MRGGNAGAGRADVDRFRQLEEIACGIGSADKYWNLQSNAR
jgi:hypothetical protein